MLAGAAPVTLDRWRESPNKRVAWRPAPRSAHPRLELRPERLRRRLDPARLPFASTEDVEPLSGTIGQPHALEALDYGLAVDTHGFNLFVAGAPGSGRLTTVLDFLRVRSPTKRMPNDWVYVHNFTTPHRPNAIARAAAPRSSVTWTHSSRR